MDLELELQKVLAASRSPAWQRAVALARHYRWSQMMRRAVRVVGQKLNPHRTVGAAKTDSKASLRPISPELRRLARIQIEAFGQRSAATDGRLDDGFVCLLHESRDVGRPVDWQKAAQDRDVSHLWQFQLQYHEFLLGYLARNGESAWDLIWETLAGWLEAFPPESTKVTADAWHSYCISRRVPVWCWLVVEGNPTDELKQRLLQSLSAQCEYLSQNLEFELGGNHLLENVAALTIAAGLIDSPQALGWLSAAERVWRAEKRTQILPHGEHFERSPMYHCQVVGNLLQQAIAVQSFRPDLTSEWSSSASEMLEFLDGILHPNGEIPLLADSGFEEAPSVEHLRQLAAICPNVKGAFGKNTNPPAADFSNTRMVGPYWTSRVARAGCETFVVVDCGEVGAAELPAHAHADLITLEVSIDGKRWIVDSGNFSYAASSMRDYCRSSLGHNVLTIGGQNSCEVWGGFRMGRRGRITSTHSADEREFSWVQVSHDGYRHLGISEIQRTVSSDRQGNVVVADLVRGATELPAIGYVHLAPEVTVRPNGGDREWIVSRDGEERLLQFEGVDVVELADGWYCPAFGVRQRSSVIVYRRRTAVNALLIWRLVHQGTNGGEFSTAIVQPLLQRAASR
ncbi:MAG: alginate lyase family protein [Pirellulaceae bacterium]